MTDTTDTTEKPNSKIKQDTDRELKSALSSLFQEVTDSIIKGDEVTDSLEIIKKNYKINFNMKLYTDSDKESVIYYSDPKIIIEYYNTPTDTIDYKSFDDLESLTDNFIEKIKETRNKDGDLQFISIFKSHYNNKDDQTGKIGGSDATPAATTATPAATPTASTNYKLSIDYDIVIKLQKSKGKTIVEEYLLHIKELKTEQDTASNKTNKYSTDIDYDINLNGLEEPDKTNISENLKKLGETKKENDMINFDISSLDKNAVSKVINLLSEKTYKIDAEDNEFFSNWVNYDELDAKKKELITSGEQKGGATTEVASVKIINSEDVQKFIFNLLGYEFIRINRILMIFNTDIFIKILTLISNDEYAKKYKEFIQLVYLRVNKKNLNKIYQDTTDEIYKTIDANTTQYNKIMKDESTMEEIDGGSNGIGTLARQQTAIQNALNNPTSFKTDSLKQTGLSTSTVVDPQNSEFGYIFSYLLFKKLFNDFFGNEITPNARYDKYLDFSGMGDLDDNCKIFRIMLTIILKIEKNIISILNIINDKYTGGKIKDIETDFINLSTKNKRVVSIVKRRHDFSTYDKNHPLYKTVKSNLTGALKTLNYLDIYYINKPETIQLFTYYDPYGRFKLKNLPESAGADKEKLTTFRTKFYPDQKYNPDNVNVTENDTPEYFYNTTVATRTIGESDASVTTPQTTQTINIEKLDTSKYNEKHKFGPFDYVYNQEETVPNSKIAKDIQSQINSSFSDGKNIMMNGFGQSGSGKTSTLIKLISKFGDEDGVLIEYLKTLKGKINSVKIECVNLYFNETTKKIARYDLFDYSNYQIQIYGKDATVEKTLKDLREYSSQNHNIIAEINVTTDFEVAIGQVGAEILKLFDRRQVLPTPNNEKSSRSHIIVCLTFTGTDQIYNGKKMIVCDLAGVENVFKCDEEAELMKFESQYDMIYRNATRKENPDKQAEVALTQLGLTKDPCIQKSIRFLKDTENFKDKGFNFDIIKQLNGYQEIKTALENELKKTELEYTAAEKKVQEVERGRITTTSSTANINIINSIIAIIKAISDYKDNFTVNDELTEAQLVGLITAVGNMNPNIKAEFNLPQDKYDSTFKNFYRNLSTSLSKVNNSKINEFTELIRSIDTAKADFASLPNRIKDLKTKIGAKDTEIKNLGSKILAEKNNRNKGILTNQQTAVKEEKTKLEDALSIIEAEQITKPQEINQLITTIYAKITEVLESLKTELINNIEIIIKNKQQNSSGAEGKATLKKAADDEKYRLLHKKIEYSAVIKCLDNRFTQITGHCQTRVKEGYMINRSLAELSSGISTIVYENSFEGLPIYIEKQIDPKCRNNFLDYYIFDKFKPNTTTGQKDIMQYYEKYGVILCILEFHYGIQLKDLIFYNLLVYNTSFFSLPNTINYKVPGLGVEITANENRLIEALANTTPINSFNVGSKNNPPNPPYVNINILKYFTRINKNQQKLEEVTKLFWNYVNKYEFYRKNPLPTEGSDIFQKIETWITMIDRNNAGTLLGTLETTDLLQTVAFKDVGCNNLSSEEESGDTATSEPTDTDYIAITKIFKETTAKITENCKNALFASKSIKQDDKKFDAFKKYISEEIFKKRDFKGKVSNPKKGGNLNHLLGFGKTLRKQNTKRKTMKRKILKTRRLHRKTKLRRTYKKY